MGLQWLHLPILIFLTLPLLMAQIGGENEGICMVVTGAVLVMPSPAIVHHHVSPSS